MSPNFEDRENEKVGAKLAKLNEKKSDRELARARDIHTKEANFVGRTTWKVHSGAKKMRNANGHQGENDRLWKNGEQEHKQQNFCEHNKMCN